MQVTDVAYHPDPDIDAEVRQQAIEAERLDLAIGYPPRRWICTCGASHTRGHFPLGVIGSHRCLNCGYVGFDGIMVDEQEWAQIRETEDAAE